MLLCAHALNNTKWDVFFNDFQTLWFLKSKQNVSLVTFLLSFCRNRGCWGRRGISSAKLRKNETWALVRTHKSRTWKSRHWWRIPSGNRGNWYAGSARRINQEERTNQAWTSRNERSGEEWERCLVKIKVNPDSDFCSPIHFCLKVKWLKTPKI